MNAIWIVLPILFLLMFDLGLTLEWKDFLLFRRRPRAVFTGLVGQIIVLPALAMMLGWTFSLPPLARLLRARRQSSHRSYPGRKAQPPHSVKKVKFYSFALRFFDIFGDFAATLMIEIGRASCRERV